MNEFVQVAFRNERWEVLTHIYKGEVIAMSWKSYMEILSRFAEFIDDQNIIMLEECKNEKEIE